MGRNAGALAAVTVMLPVVPLVTGAKPPSAAPSTRNWTLPLGVPPVTVALTVIVPFDATFVLVTVSCVLVATGGGVPPPPPPLPPPQLVVKQIKQSRIKPRVTREYLRGRESSSKTASAAPPVKGHESLVPV